MNVTPTAHVRARVRDADHGFTLIELIIALVLSSLIAGVIVAALITSLNVASSTTAQISDSTDAGLITSFLTRDAQSSGAIVPTTALRDTTVGVSTDATTAGWSGCTQAPATLVVRFSWIDHTSASAQSKVVVTYAFDSSKAQLTRRLCKDSTPGVDLVLGRDLVSASATCDTVCTGAPTTVSLLVTGAGTRAPLVYTLKASLRGDTQAAPTVINSSPVPLLALGAGASVGCPNLEMAGTGAITVLGNAMVDGLCGALPIKGDLTLLQPTGTTSTISGIVDPFLARQAPVFTCPASGTNPATGVSSGQDAVVVYPLAVKITLPTVFQPGRYVFCHGLEMTTGLVTGTDVLLYIAGDSLWIRAGATVDLTGRRATAIDANMLIWEAVANQTIKVDGGPDVSSLRGLIYAPTSRMELSSVMAANIGGMNVQGLKITGVGQARLGLPVPVIAITPTSLPAGQANVAYTANLAAAGGNTPYTWFATGLPSGISINPTTGVISGTPTAAAVASPIVVTAFDFTKAAASIDYSLTINPALGISTSTLPNGQVGVAFTSTTMTGTGGTPPYTWTATGLPAGVSINLATGVVSGTPTVSGTFSVVVTVTDKVTNASKTYPVTINGVLTVPVPALPSGQAGVAYTSTTETSTGGTAPYTWSQTGLPAGLTIDPATGTVSGTPTASGTFSVIVTVTDAVLASAQATYPVTIAAAIVACPATTIPWQGQYYSNATLSGTPTLLREDANINFDWGSGSPGGGLPADKFSVRWTRTTDFAAGSYTFALGTDDGGRLYIDGALVLNRWVDQAYPTPQPTVTQSLTKGSHTLIVEYYENGGNASATLVTTLPTNGVTSVPSVCGDQSPGENRITLTNSSPITAMTVTIKVAQTTGVTFNGQYGTFSGSIVTASNSVSSGFLVYTFTLKSNKTIVVGSWTLAAQWNGNGTPHATSGDTWSVMTTTSGGTVTVTGTF